MAPNKVRAQEAGKACGCRFVIPSVDSANRLPRPRPRSALPPRGRDCLLHRCDMRLCETARRAATADRLCPVRLCVACSRQQPEPATGRRPTAVTTHSPFLRTYGVTEVRNCPKPFDCVCVCGMPSIFFRFGI